MNWKKINYKIANFLSFGLLEKTRKFDEWAIPEYFKRMEKKGIKYCASGDPKDIPQDLRMMINKEMNTPWYMY